MEIRQVGVDRRMVYHGFSFSAQDNSERKAHTWPVKPDPLDPFLDGCASVGCIHELEMSPCLTRARAFTTIVESQ